MFSIYLWPHFFLLVDEGLLDCRAGAGLGTKAFILSKQISKWWVPRQAWASLNQSLLAVQLSYVDATYSNGDELNVLPEYRDHLMSVQSSWLSTSKRDCLESESCKLVEHFKFWGARWCAVNPRQPCLCLCSAASKGRDATWCGGYKCIGSVYKKLRPSLESDFFAKEDSDREAKVS